MAGYMGMPGVEAPTTEPGIKAWGSVDGKPVNGVAQPTGTQGGGTVPHVDLYKSYGAAIAGKGFQDYMSRRSDVGDPNERHVFDPFPGSRQGRLLDGTTPQDGRGREYMGPWVNPYDRTTYTTGNGYRGSEGDQVFKYNQMLMTTAEAFDPFIQKDVLENPHQWINRIPRRAYQLFNGLVHETNIFRGGLEVYAGLGDWEPLQADPRVKDPCGPMKYRTYDYAWEKMSWSGMKTAWGSDPFCIDMFKFIPGALEQLGWIIDQGARFGIAIQNIWNRDNFIKFSVQAGRSYVMSKEYRGTSSARYVYEPLCKIVSHEAWTRADNKSLVADGSLTGGHPFFVIDATVDMEPVNFDSLQILRRELERVASDSNVTTIGGSKVYAIGISSDDLDKYIRGNEEERKNYIEANPAALIKGFDIAPNTFRKWVVMEDGDQLRGNIVKYIANYTEEEAAAFGYVGLRELEGKPVMIAAVVDPVRAGRPGINGAPIPEPNPEYDLAEVAIAPVFLNNVFTNEFVPSCPGIGHGTYFGVVGGLNGSWKWYNIQTEDNPDQKIGNFRGLFEIVPRPEKRAVYATSFVYRRCAQPLKSLCPVENEHINPAVKVTSAGIGSGMVDAGFTAEVVLKTDMVLKGGDLAKVTVPSATEKWLADGATINVSARPTFAGGTWSYTAGGKTYTCADGGTTESDSLDAAKAFFAEAKPMRTSGDTESISVQYVAAREEATYDAMVYSAPTMRVKRIQFVGDSKPAAGVDLTGGTVANA